ncbi:MAG: GNAT family N-acetyltransferase [Candidatus Eisenbacteria bacterium]|nr:GNAT family N-acetyltransferase [Candidatus Eisenbacteria bacterium]
MNFNRLSSRYGFSYYEVSTVLMGEDMAQGKRSQKKTKKKRSKESAPRVEIRPMELNDLPAVFGLGDKTFTVQDAPNLYRTWDEDELLDLFASGRDTCLVAEAESGEILGFLLGTTVEKRRSAWSYGYVVWLCVDEEGIGQGVGTRLVEQVTEVFIKKGARMMLADTDASNVQAIGFFESLGFSNPEEHVYLSCNLTRHPSYTKRRPRVSAARPGGARRRSKR